MVPRRALQEGRWPETYKQEPELLAPVKCDEEDTHTVGNIVKDQARRQTLTESLQCSFVRFRPQQPGFQIAVVINDCMKALKLV